MLEPRLALSFELPMRQEDLELLFMLVPLKGLQMSATMTGGSNEVLGFKS